MKRILAAMLALALIAAAVSCSGKSQDSGTVADTAEMSLINSALGEKGATEGDDSTFNRKYVDVSYDIAYLGKVYDGEPEILPEGTLKDWTENVFLKKSPEEQDALPVMYQAVHELGVTKDQLTALNNSRRELGEYMILDDDYINSLYIGDKAEMKRALAGPAALYYDGELYTWNELNAVPAPDIVSRIPKDVMDTYIAGVISYLETSEIMSQEEIEIYITDNTGTTSGQ